MAKVCNQKAKILYLERMLWETHETRTLSMQEILTRLEGYGIHAERKSIYDDMEVLRGFGMNIQYKKGCQGGYYLASRDEADAVVQEMFGKYSGDIKGAEEGPKPEQQQAEEVKDVKAPKVTPHISKSRGKKIKLRFTNDLRNEAEQVLGKDLEYREKGEDTFTVSVCLEEDSKLFGWLASMDRKVHIIKPVKTALAYRDFLKGIAKNYKGIDK